MVTNLASVDSGVLTMGVEVVKVGLGVVKVGAEVMKVGAGVMKVGAGVVKVGAEVVKMGLRVPSVNIVLKTDNNRVMSLYFGTFNIPLQCTTTMVHRNTINSVTIKQLTLRI